MDNVNSGIMGIVRQGNVGSRKLASPDQDTVIHSDLLFANGDLLFIQHQGEQYCLRRTRNGKLILNK